MDTLHFVPVSDYIEIGHSKVACRAMRACIMAWALRASLFKRPCTVLPIEGRPDLMYEMAAEDMGGPGEIEREFGDDICLRTGLLLLAQTYTAVAA